MSFRDLFSSKPKKGPEPEPVQKAPSEHKSDIDSLLQIEPRQDPSKITMEDLYPFGPPDYSLKAPEADASFMYQHTAVCPVCHQTFTTPVLSITKLQVKSIDHDLRKRYRNTEPLWYRIWHCPHCYYAALEQQFEEGVDTSLHKDEVMKAMSIFKDAEVLTYTEPRTINQVLTSIYLALLWARFWDLDYSLRAKLWLYLSWLYDDLGEKELYLKTSEKALEYYRRMYYTYTQEFDPVVEQTCFLVISELFIRLGDFKNAYDSLQHVITLKNGKRLYITDARSRLSEVREMMKENRES